MRLLCPNCQKELQVDDRYAGQLMKCPLCTGTFTVPMLPSMPGAAAAPPPPPPPQAPAPLPPVQMHAPANSGGMTPQYQPAAETGPRPSLTISPRFITWLAPFSLIVVFVLMFFPWGGMYPGGIGVVTQSGWGTAFGSTAVDPDWDQFATRETTKPWDKYYGASVEKLKSPGANGLMIIYVLVIVPAFLISVASMLIGMKILPLQPPAALAGVWGYRSLLVSALAFAGLVLLLTQLMSGSTLEATAVDQAKKDLATERGNPSAPSVIKRWDIEEGIRVGGYNIHTTKWLGLVVFFNALAVLGGVLDYLVERKGPQGMPQLNWAGS